MAAIVKDKDHNKELSPFERFQELARRLFAVPKAELDKKKAEHQLERKKIKAAKA